MPDQLITRKDEGAVRVLLLDRPPSNTLNISLLDALIKEIDQAGADSRVRCVLVGSTQPKYFSAGLDLKEMLSLPLEKRSGHFERLASVHRKLAALPKPTVAAIEGYALLGGFVLALGCDMRCIAESTGKVALSEIRLGITPTTPLIRLVFGLTGRPGLVKDLVMRGKTLRAPEALQAGLVDEVLPNAGFLESALRAASQWAKLPPKAYASIKRAARASLLPDEEALWKQAFREFNEISNDEEAQEGLLAMEEKRKPRWE